MNKLSFIFLIVLAIMFTTNCSKDGDVNIFTVKDDIEFGSKLDQEILANPAEYPILDKQQNPEAYKFIENIMYSLLKSDLFLYKDQFTWQIRIINQDVKNAFAAPGGYLYFYSGMLKYSKSEAEIAGVIAHEMAHTDRRHSTEQLTKAYGLSMLLGIVVGKEVTQMEEILSQLALGSASLKFSRNDEYEADEYSVRYMADIKNVRNYQPTAIIDFFDRLVADGYTSGKGNFEFLQTHPYEEHRKTNINDVWTELGKPSGSKFESEYSAFLKLLP